MNIRKPNMLKQAADQKLAAAPQKNRIMLIYCAIVLAACILTTGLNYFLDFRMAQAGGLSNLGLRSVLSTFQTVAPILHSAVLLVLDLGLLGAMLRISRGLYTSPQTLRLGIARCGALIRLTLLQMAMYVALGVMLLYGSIVIFFMTPLANDAVALMEPLAASGVDTQTAVNSILGDQAFISQFFRSVMPMYIIFLVLSLAVAIPLNYRLSMAQYVLLDDPTAGALRAVFMSMRMTKRNCMALFKLDLSFWWYYLLTLAVMALSYGDLLPLNLPLPQETVTLLFYGVYLILQSVIYYFLRPKLEVCKAFIFDAIRPKPENSGVVLGNIFQN